METITLGSLRVLVAGLVFYFCPPAFRHVADRWFPDSPQGTEHDDRLHAMRGRFWRSLLLVLLFVVLVISVLTICGIFHHSRNLWLRITAMVIALSATLGRGGWDIQTIKGKSLLERIDRGMFAVSQLGATAILILAFTL